MRSDRLANFDVLLGADVICKVASARVEEIEVENLQQNMFFIVKELMPSGHVTMFNNKVARQEEVQAGAQDVVVNHILFKKAHHFNPIEFAHEESELDIHLESLFKLDNIGIV